MSIAVIILVILAYLFIAGLLKAKSKARREFFDKWEEMHNGKQ
jgi:hypothetical protein